MSELTASPLGKENVYTDQYDPTLLFAICRDGNRINIGIDIKKLPFRGVDIWNGFDFTWLDANNIPQFGILSIYIPCESPNLIESKSLKLYLFSFANSSFDNENEIIKILEKDLSQCAGNTIKVHYSNNAEPFSVLEPTSTGLSLDQLTISCDEKNVNPDLLGTDDTSLTSEILCSDYLKSNCLVTGKPDWGSVRISYTGPQINHEGLLKYIVSYRNHQGFHEQCIEKIFYDILTICKPLKLSVEGRYTRRGGLDINPIRTNVDIPIKNNRLYRQ